METLSIQLNLLSQWLKLATQEQRQRLAILAGTSVSYLYQLAGGHRTVPRADLAFRLEDAFTVLHKESKSRLPLISARYLAEMYATAQLVDEDSPSAQS